jgi:hypothetical protein
MAGVALLLYWTDMKMSQNLKFWLRKMTRTLGTLVKFCDIRRVNNFVYIALTIKIIIILETLNLDISQDPSMSKSRHEYI